jgi:hypothetical protein
MLSLKTLATKHNTMRIFISLTLCAILLVLGCKPERADDYSLNGTATAPSFTVEVLAGPENKVAIKDMSQDNFQRLWDLPGAAPKSSNKAIDTIQYAKAGTYQITLHVSSADGSGTAVATKEVLITQDAPLTCNPKLALLTGDCGPSGKCWTLSRVAGAVRVGPTYDDYSWFTSVVDGLQNEQYDDGFCFTFDGLIYENRNNVASVNPWNGYQAQAHAPGLGSFTYTEGTGTLGRDQILLEDDTQFMGVWDCDNLLDIMKLTATELKVRGRQREQNGTPKAEGWFELTFVPK